MAPGRAGEGGPREGSGDWRRVSGTQPNRPGFWTRPIPAGVELGLGPTLDLVPFPARTLICATSLKNWAYEVK